MNHTKFATIAHRDHAVCCPISIEKADRLFALLDLPSGARVLDVGCGKAALLERLIERFGCLGVGVDSNPHFLAEARARGFDRGVAGKLELAESEVAKMSLAPASFDAALCVGATRAVYGSYANTVRSLAALVKPGGKVVVGEHFWMRKPDVGYLKASGVKLDDYTEHAGNVATGLAEKQLYLYSVVADSDDLDHYAGLYIRAVEAWCLDNPRDLDATAARDRIRTWRDTYLKWGRETLGFAVYLFQK